MHSHCRTINILGLSLILPFLYLYCFLFLLCARRYFSLDFPRILSVHLHSSSCITRSIDPAKCPGTDYSLRFQETSKSLVFSEERLTLFYYYCGRHAQILTLRYCQFINIILLKLFSRVFRFQFSIRSMDNSCDSLTKQSSDDAELVASGDKGNTIR